MIANSHEWDIFCLGLFAGIALLTGIQFLFFLALRGRKS